LAPTHRTSSVYPITDLQKYGPLGWRCDHVTPYPSRCFHSHIWSSNTRQICLGLETATFCLLYRVSYHCSTQLKSRWKGIGIQRVKKKILAADDLHTCRPCSFWMRSLKFWCCSPKLTNCNCCLAKRIQSWNSCSRISRLLEFSSLSFLVFFREIV